MLFVIFVENGSNAFIEADSLEEARAEWNSRNNPYGYEGAGTTYEYGGRAAVASEIAAYENDCDFGDISEWW